MTVRVVAEVGCNHGGSLETAKAMIREAAACGVYAVKFQKRCPRECLTEAEYNAPHPVPSNSYGSTYGEHREALELTIDQHVELAEECERAGVVYSTSVWDLTSAREVVGRICPDFVKVPSALNTRKPLLRYLIAEYGGGLHVSTGMTTREEVDGLRRFLWERGALERVVVYACTSGYPVPFNEAHLLEVSEAVSTWHCDAAGYSGHHLGIALDAAAVALGATWIERHFTLDRTWKGTDHAASLEPGGLRKLCRDVAAVSEALTCKPPGGLSPVEVATRAKLKQWAS